MKIIRGQEISFEPASHEDRNYPGVLKKILCQRDDLMLGRVQMINWARLPAGCSFRLHYHEDMEEIFVIIKGSVLMKVGEEETTLGVQEAVIIPPMMAHQMTNLLDSEAEYLVVGITSGKNGKTVVV